jgi:hypothetical protein
MRSRIRLLLVALLASAGALVFSVPAGAVQTTTWGMTAAPTGHGFRSSIDHAADGSTVHDAVILFNRTDSPITIHLYLLGTTYAHSAYQFGPPRGLAAQTTLGTHNVTLAARQQERVPVTIRMPRGVKATSLAGIGAEAAAVNDGALSIQQQLVVLIKASPSEHVLPIVGKHLRLWASIALIVLLAVVAIAEHQRRQAKSSRRSVRAGSVLPSL